MRYKVGDKVRVRAWDDMEKEFGLNASGDIKCRCWFTRGMRDSCGKIVQIESVSPEIDAYYIKDDFHAFTDDMLEAVAYDFKVGDRVRIVKDVSHCAKIGATGVICRELMDGMYDYGVRFDKANPRFHDCADKCEKDRGQYVMVDEIEKITTCAKKIVITSDGKTTLARLYENGKVTKTAKAECSPGDKFDFAVGAKLAFERLNEKTEPKVYFNGKAVCIEVKEGAVYTVGKIYEFKNGRCKIDNDCLMPVLRDPITSIDNWNERYLHGELLAKFLEIKE